MKKGVIITGSIIAVVIIGIVCLAENFRLGGYGEEYHKVWKCDGYNIRIDSDARKFPDPTF